MERLLHPEQFQCPADLAGLAGRMNEFHLRGVEVTLGKIALDFRFGGGS